MKRLAKYLVASVLGMALLGLFIVFFSSTETRYECSGALTEKGTRSPPTTVYLKIAEYRWWVGLWSRSDGEVWLEIPHKLTEYYGNVSRSGDNLLINAPSEKQGIGGIYSKLSSSLSLQTPIGVFEGRCKRIDA